MGATSGASAAGGATTEQGLNIQNLQSILQNMGFSPQEQVRLSSGCIGVAPGSRPICSLAGSGAHVTMCTRTFFFFFSSDQRPDFMFTSRILVLSAMSR